MMVFALCSVVCAICVLQAQAWRLQPTEPFAPPVLRRDEPILQAAFRSIDTSISEAGQNDSQPWKRNITSFSIAVTSSSQTLWTSSHTASVLGDYADSPPNNVSDGTYFRIASISKVFTVLAALIEQEAKTWTLKDPITKWVPELLQTANPHLVDWENISLESLASQLGGVVREYGQSDLIDPFEDRQYGFNNPVEVGLPPVDGAEIPPCGENRPGTRPCTRKGTFVVHGSTIDRIAILIRISLEILDGLITRPPLFEPNDRATYSNMNFVLLGFALEALSGQSYKEILDQKIFQPLGMERSRLTKPPDGQGVIPNATNDWNADIGTYGPTGGIYTTASDLMRLARAILNHELLNKSTTNAWFKPHSYSPSWSFAYGMPWEIFRSSDLLPDSNRIQTILTKAGGLRGYSSQLLLLPEYNIGIIVLVAGDGHALAWLREEILKAVVPAVDAIARKQAAERFSGTYASPDDTHMNSSISVEVQGSSGLMLTSWISNGTNFLATYVKMSQKASGSPGRPGKVQLTPSGTNRGSSNGDVVWRAQFVADELPAAAGVIDMHLVTDVDTFTYAARSVEEFVFATDSEGIASEVRLPGLRITLTKQRQQQPKTAGSNAWDDRSVWYLMRPL
ncbi:MAG: hypothetical protein Q9197_006292, partial [Variospora fuerteventurae]